MKQIKYISAIGLGLLLLLTGCKKETPAQLRDGVERLADYLYQTKVYEYDRSQALSRLQQSESLLPCGGSVVHNGAFVGVNVDGYYDSSAEFVVVVPSFTDRFGSMGIAGGVKELTEEVVKSGTDSEWYALLPYLLTDGMNENGVVCSLCALPIEAKDEQGATEGSLELTSRMLPRYVLDNARSAAHAVELLSAVRLLPAASGPAYQLMVADSTATYVCQWVDGKMQTTTENPILTNFPILQADKPAHSRGLERFTVAETHFSRTSTLEGMTKLMHILRASQMYDRKLTPFRYSDYNGDWTADGFADLCVTSAESDYEPYIKAQLKKRQKNKRDAAYNLWFTRHTALYDMRTLTMRVYVQEDYSYLYTLVPEGAATEE